MTYEQVKAMHNIEPILRNIIQKYIPYDKDYRVYDVIQFVYTIHCGLLLKGRATTKTDLDFIQQVNSDDLCIMLDQLFHHIYYV